MSIGFTELMIRIYVNMIHSKTQAQGMTFTPPLSVLFCTETIKILFL